MYGKIINTSTMKPEQLADFVNTIPFTALVLVVHFNNVTGVLLLPTDSTLEHNLETPFRFIRYIMQFLGKSGLFQVTKIACFCQSDFVFPEWFNVVQGKFYF